MSGDSVTLDVLMRQSVEAALTSEKLAEKCRLAAEKAIDEAIGSAFSYSSPFRKMIEEAVKTSLPVVRPEDLGVFTNCVKTVVQSRLVNMADEVARRQMNEVLESILPDATVIEMKDFRAAYIDRLRDQVSRDDFECFDREYKPDFTWMVEQTKTSNEWWDLRIAPVSGAGRYDKDTICLRFKSAGDADLHKCWHASVGRNDQLVVSIFSGPLYGFDAMLFRLYSGVAKLRATV